MATKKSKATKAKALPAYTNVAPAGMFAVGTTVRYLGEGKSKKVKKGDTGTVFGYRPNRKGGGLYYCRFSLGEGKSFSIILSAKRLAKVGGKAKPAAKKPAKKAEAAA